MKYPGGKAGSGVYQRIISQMPPHSVYVEPFLGGGAVMRLKRAARLNYGIDLDGAAVRRAASLASRGEWTVARAAPAGGGDADPEFRFCERDGVAFLSDFGHGLLSGSRALVYCDPPYLMSTRSSQRRVYQYELDEPGHSVLLDVLVGLACMVMVSGYESELYCRRLSSWRVVKYRTMMRGGRMAEEWLWCNFPEPVELHDYRYYGRDYRERERVGRKRARWLRRLSEMPVLERRLIESALLEVRARGESRQDGLG